MADSQCVFDFDQVVDLSRTDMPRENKKEVIEKMIDDYLECAFPEQEEEAKNKLVPSLILTVIEQGEKLLNLTNSIDIKTDKIIELEDQINEMEIKNIINTVVFTVIGITGGIIGGIVIKKYV